MPSPTEAPRPAVRSTSRPPHRRALAVAATAAAVLAALVLPPAATQAAVTPAGAGQVRSMLLAAHNGSGWLRERLVGDLPLQNFGSGDWGATLDAALGVAAADRAYDDDMVELDRVWAAVVDARDTVVAPGDSDDPGRVAKVILLADALGEDPHAIGTVPGADLVARLLATLRTDGPDAGLFGAADPTYDGAYRQGLALRALGAIGGEVPAAAVAWLLDQQCPSGAWMPYRADLATECAVDLDAFVGPDTNSTAAAMDGLDIAGADASTAIDGAIDWIASTQNDDGGWGFFEGDASDVNSTSVVLQAVVPLGGLQDVVGAGDPTAGPSPVTFLVELQVACGDAAAGGFPYQPGLDADVLATSQAVAALALSGNLRAGDDPAGAVALTRPTEPCVRVTGSGPDPTGPGGPTDPTGPSDPATATTDPAGDPAPAGLSAGAPPSPAVQGGSAAAATTAGSSTPAPMAFTG